jgi:hypothetical protein
LSKLKKINTIEIAGGHAIYWIIMALDFAQCARTNLHRVVDVLPINQQAMK